MLRVTDLVAGYGAARVLKAISLEIERGEAVALLGPNGAGKTTTVMSIAGNLKPWSGQISIGGRVTSGLRSFEVARRGVAVVPEGRQVFADLTVAENLAVGGYRHSDHKLLATIREEVLELFPVLKARLQQRAGTLSGGEQQMLAIGRALMSKPDLLIIDELTMGLAPRVIETLHQTLADILSRGMTALIVEQNPTLALALAGRGYVMANGAIIHAGTAAELRQSEVLQDVYLSGRARSKPGPDEPGRREPEPAPSPEQP